MFLVREKAAKVTIPLAMKVVQKHDAFYSDGSLRHAVDERLVLGLVKEFPFVITLTHAFQTDTALYMVSHFCPGGDLRTMLKRQRHGRMPEQRARGIMAQLVLALEHLHSLNVIYRDVKPGNVLLSADGDVRLCDFGLSKVITGGRSGRTKSFCGSTAYMSPQIINARSYGIATDMWSLGALFFTMLVGRTPFEKASAAMAADNDVAHIEKRIVTEEPKYPSFLSKPATDMIAGLLRKNEEERTKMKDLKKSMFFVGVDWTAILEEGYERAAKPAEALAHRDLENFDCKRLISHGIALQDEELDKEVVRSDMLGERERVQRRRGSLLGRVGFSQGFVRRQASALVSKGSLRRDGVARRNSSSIIGFGYSRKSDFGVNGTDSETDRSRGGVQLV